MPKACEGSNERNHTGQSNGGGPFQAGEQRPESLGIAAAIAVCEKAVGDGREKSGTETEDGTKRDQQIAALTSWATENNLWLPHFIPDKLRDAGTREHVLFHHDEEPDRIFKITKGPGFGIYPLSLTRAHWRAARYWFTDRPATPLEYFRRLFLSNVELLNHLDRLRYPVLNRLDGFVRCDGNLQAVISQPIFEGIPADPRKMTLWFQNRGFEFIRSWAWFRPVDGLAVFDTWMDNVMDLGDQLVPFDAIPVKATGNLLTELHAALEHVRKSSL